MGLKTIIFHLIVTAIFLLVESAHARTFEVGASFNYLSNGFHLTYQLPTKSKWAVGVGIRIMVNTYALNINDENRVYYQNGFASKIWEYPGLSGRIRYSTIRYKNLGLDISGNLLFTWHGLKVDVNDVYDVVTGQYSDDVIYTRPGLALEFVVGPNLHYDISKRVRMNLFVGLGVSVRNYSRQSVSLVTGKKIERIRLSEYQGRLDHSYVGLDGLPGIYFGVAYKVGN